MAIPDANNAAAFDHERHPEDRKNATPRRVPTSRATRTLGPPRGILKQPSVSGEFHHVRIAPPVPLVGVVQHFWVVRWNLHGRSSQLGETLPHPNVHIVFESNEARVQGIHQGRFTRVLEGQGAVLGVKFRAGGFRPFLGRSVSTLRNRSIPLSDVFGVPARSLAQEVLAQRDDECMVDTVARFLFETLPAADSNVERVARIVSEIEADRSLVKVEQLLDRSNITKRVLQRLFAEYVGVSPKWVINRYRLHEALERLHSGAPVDWSQLAQELGYFDQSHFIRDFKSLVGRSPLRYARE